MSIDRLTALDRLMLWASRRWPQDIGALAVLEGEALFDEAGRFRIEAPREAIARRLSLAPRFRQLIQVPRRGLGGPYWVDAVTLDLSHHVRVLPLEPPAGEAEVLAAVESVLRQRLDPSRPLWEMWFLTGMPARRVALFVRVHHAIADGMAAMATLATLLDSPADGPEPAPRSAPSPWPSAGALLADNAVGRLRGIVRALSVLARPRTTLRRVRLLWPAIRELLAEQPATRTSLDRMVGPNRRLAVIGTDLAAVREMARAHGATVNDVLLSVTAGGLRALLDSRGEPVADTTLRIYVPVSLRRRLRGPQQGNLIAQMAVPLGLGERDADRRLRQIAAETAVRKERARTSLGSLLHGGPLARLLLVAVMRQRVNLASTSIPGPTEPLRLAGAQILEVFPVLPLIAKEPIAIGALSYAGVLRIGITADADAIPDVGVLAAALRGELEALGLATMPAFEGSDRSALAAGARAAGALAPARAVTAPTNQPGPAPPRRAAGAAPCR